MKPVRTGSHSRFRPAIQSAVLLSLTVLLAAGFGGCGGIEAPPSSAVPEPVVANNLKQMGLAVQNYQQYMDGSVHFNNDQSVRPAGDKVSAFLTPAEPDSGNDQEGRPAEAPATPARQANDPSRSADRPAALPRKIIYDARIDLLVKSLDATERAIRTLIDENGAFLAESNIAAQTGTQRDATWRVRVPVDRFDSFVSAVTRLGEVRTNHIGSQDVTEEYFDIDARIRNKQEEEKRLLKHLADSTGKLEDILSVERELTRVRGEVEQMQGRLRFLADRAALSTVTINVTEWKDYAPPVAMTLSAQLSHTFFGSLQALTAFGKSLLFVLVALVPWIPLIVIGLLMTRWFVRSAHKSGPTGTKQPVSPPAASPS